MTRPTGPFAPPPPKKAPTVKRDTNDEAREKAYVRARDRGCVAREALQLGGEWTHSRTSTCDGPIDVDHVRASGGLGMKSPTTRRNLVCLCRHHHRAKTEYGRVWRPLLIAYLKRVEGATDAA